MKKALFSTLAAAILAGSLGLSAMAETIGVVDTAEIGQKYAKAVALQAQIKSKEEELTKMRDGFLAQLKEAEKKSPVEKKNLEDKLNADFTSRFKEYREWTVAQEQALKATVDQAIQKISTSKSISLILPKQVVMQGGTDITQEVIETLNRQ